MSNIQVEGTICVTANTFFKKHPTPVANLKSTDWEKVAEGEEFSICWCGEVQGHHEVLKDGDRWYIFTGHCTFKSKGGNYLYLTKTDRKDSYGGYVLRLQYFKNGIVVDEMHVCSGQPDKQYFRIGKESKSGSGEPLPEGRWYICDILWAGGSDNYGGATFSSGEGPAVVPLTYDGPGITARSGVEIHVDWNRAVGFPGTIACVGCYTVENFKKLVRWLRETNPRYMFVDWGHGTCPLPK